MMLLTELLVMEQIAKWVCLVTHEQERPIFAKPLKWVAGLNQCCELWGIYIVMFAAFPLLYAYI